MQPFNFVCNNCVISDHGSFKNINAIKFKLQENNTNLRSCGSGCCFSMPGRFMNSRRGRMLKNSHRTHLGMRYVRGVLKFHFSTKIVLNMASTSISTVNMRYLANRGKLLDDGGRRFVTRTLNNAIFHRSKHIRRDNMTF